MIAHLVHISLPIRGMTCASCVNHVERALQSVPGISNVSVNLATETISLDYDSHQTNVDRLSQAIREAGYDIPLQSQQVNIGGMTCASCVNHVEKALGNIPGVMSVTVNLATKQANVSAWAEMVSTSDLHQAITDAGYTVKVDSATPYPTE